MKLGDLVWFVRRYTADGEIVAYASGGHVLNCDAEKVAVVEFRSCGIEIEFLPKADVYTTKAAADREAARLKEPT